MVKKLSAFCLPQNRCQGRTTLNLSHEINTFEYCPVYDNSWDRIRVQPPTVEEAIIHLLVIFIIDNFNTIDVLFLTSRNTPLSVHHN